MVPAHAQVDRPLEERALDALRRAGNPFRNYFARNPDDEICARYHVPELFAEEREKLLGVVDLYRTDPAMHSEVVPILGNKGAGKTHLLHSIKHGSDGAWQLLVTPGTFQKGAEFQEYLLFQVIDTLLGGGKQKGARPLEYISQEVTRNLLKSALDNLTPDQCLDLFPAIGLARWARKLGFGTSQALERLQWLSDQLRIADFRNTSLDAFPASTRRRRLKIARICSEAGVEPERACELVCSYTEMKQGHNTAGLMRRHIQQGFARVALNGDEADLANFLTYGFAELDFQVRPSRQDLVLALFKVLMEVFRELRIPVVAAFDQLEDLLLARRTDDGHRVAEAFFAGIVHTMHQIDGICFLIFAERGLWNRFVPSLDGYIQDRLNNPVHVPGQGSVKALRLEAPPVELVRRVVEARVRPSLEALRDYHLLPPLFPFTAEQVEQIACTEPTLRDMLQQFRHLFDRIVYDGTAASELTDKPAGDKPPEEAPPIRDFPVDRIATPPFTIKSVAIVDAVEPSEKKPFGSQPPAEERGCESPVGTVDVWQQEISLAKQRLEPEGSLTGATRELQAGLGLFLQTCHEHGVKVGPWRLQHVVSEWTFGDHPTYGVLAIGHWTCKDGQPWKVGIGLFLGRGPGKLKDLETKLRAFEAEPPLIDHLILLRPEDDINLTGKSKTLWQEAERNGRHARLEPVSLDDFARLYAFPRILAALGEALPEGQELPNLADELQFRCEKLLEQVCMPVQQ